VVNDAITISQNQKIPQSKIFCLQILKTTAQYETTTAGFIVAIPINGAGKWLPVI
jgi:hypothetical protein